MKNFRFSLPVAALVLGIVFSAFTRPQEVVVKKGSTDYAYFLYSQSTATNENNAAMWNKVESPSGLCSNGQNVLCTILAPIADPDDEHPDFTGISNVRTSPAISSRVFKP